MGRESRIGGRSGDWEGGVGVGKGWLGQEGNNEAGWRVVVAGSVVWGEEWAVGKEWWERG